MLTATAVTRLGAPADALLSLARPVGRRSSAAALVAALVAALIVTPDAAQAQGKLLKRIQSGAKERAAAAAARAATAVTTKSKEVTDTTLQVGVAGVDSLSGRAAGGLMGMVSRARRRVPPGVGGVVAGAAGIAAPGLAPAVAQAAAQLTARGGEPAAVDAGSADAPDVLRIPLHGAVFAADADTLDVAAVAYLRQFAGELPVRGERWTVVATVAPSGDATRDQARAERRAAAVLASLVSAGVPADRLAAQGRVAPASPNAPRGGVILVPRP